MVDVNLIKLSADKESLISSRAYTFMDQYMYARNSRHNVIYDKNKTILEKEHNAIVNKSAFMLYDSFAEQIGVLDTIMVRIRNFTFTIKTDLISNIKQIMPSASQLNDYKNNVHKLNSDFKFKYLKYNISKIKYIDIYGFMNLFKIEINDFLDNNGKNVNEPIKFDKATKYIKDIEASLNPINNLMDMEEIKIMHIGELTKVTSFFDRKEEIFNIINIDFKSYQLFLRGYRLLQKILDYLRPVELNDGNIALSEAGNKPISFNDYIVIYKHFSAMAKYLIDILNLYDNTFFNKIYAIQSNIEMYANIVRYVNDTVEFDNAKNNIDLNSQNEEGYGEFDIPSLINGNSQGKQFLLDDTSDNDDIDKLEDELPDELKEYLRKHNPKSEEEDNRRVQLFI